MTLAVIEESMTALSQRYAFVIFPWRRGLTKYFYPLLQCDCVSIYVLTLANYSYGRGSDIA